MATSNDSPVVRSDRDLDLWQLAMDTVGTVADGDIGQSLER